MNASLIYAPATRPEPLARQLPQIEEIARPNLGTDKAALVEAVDAIIREVYEYAFLATHNQRQAERITTRAVNRLSKATAAGSSVDPRGLRLTVLDFVRREVLTYQRAELKRSRLHAGRANLRHAMLAGSSLVAAVYAVLVAI